MEDSDEGPICRICLHNESEPLISPCVCTGTVKWIHLSCLMRCDNIGQCSICKQDYMKKVKQPQYSLFVMVHYMSGVTFLIGYVYLNYVTYWAIGFYVLQNSYTVVCTINGCAYIGLVYTLRDYNDHVLQWHVISCICASLILGLYYFKMMNYLVTEFECIYTDTTCPDPWLYSIPLVIQGALIVIGVMNQYRSIRLVLTSEWRSHWNDPQYNKQLDRFIIGYG